MATNEEVEQAQKALEVKRSTLASLHADRRSAEAAAENDVALVAIKREEAELDAAIAQATAEAKSVQPGIAETIRDRQQRAEAQAASAPQSTQAAMAAEQRADEARDNEKGK